MQRRFHYDQAFEHYLRAKGIPYVAVDEARKALKGQTKLKNFDFVVYSQQGPNLLVDVKGRKHSGRSHKSLDNWVTADDVADLIQWQQVFGEGFVSVLVFLYWCEVQPPDALFQEIFEYRERWYAVLAVEIGEYQRHMTRRSERWETVHIPAKSYNRISRTLVRMLGEGVGEPEVSRQRR